MSDKRFKVCVDSNNGVGLYDNSARLLFIKFTNKEDALSCKDSLKYQCNLMNELYEEKEQMKKRLESSETTSDATSNYNAFLESKISTLEEENEKLQKQIQNYEQLISNSYIGEEESERFIMNKWRKDATTLFNNFRIIDKKGKIPNMHFLTEEQMIIVYNLLRDKKMVFSCY